MPIQKAVEIMWLQPGAAVGWTWNCRGQDVADDVVATSPPPLYFWFIPLAPGRQGETLSVSGCRTYCRDTPGGRRWSFEWRIANSGARELPLKINIWTPIGATSCASTS